MSQARTLTKTELNRLLKSIAIRRYPERDRAIVLMSYWAGLRVGEIASLKIADVLASNGSIQREFWLDPDQTKGNRGRSVVISKKLAGELLKYLHFRFEEGALSDLSAKQRALPLFYTQKRQGFNANTLCNYFHHLYRDANIDGASSHSGRRTFITQLASKGVSAKVLMSLAGHQHLSTVQRYIDVNDEMKREAVDLL